jgi:hypothetical protein
VIVSVVFFGIPASGRNASRMDVVALEGLREGEKGTISGDAMNIDVHVLIWGPEGTPPQRKENYLTRADGPPFDGVTRQSHLALEIRAHRKIGSWRSIQRHTSHGPEVVWEMKANGGQEQDTCAAGAPVSRSLRIRAYEVSSRSKAFFPLTLLLLSLSQDCPHGPS